MLVEFVKGAITPVIKSRDNWKTMKSVYMKILFFFFFKNHSIYLLIWLHWSSLRQTGSLFRQADLSLQGTDPLVAARGLSGCGA